MPLQQPRGDGLTDHQFYDWDLEEAFTTKQAERLREIYPDPEQLHRIFLSRDMNALIKVPGIGVINGKKVFGKYEDSLEFAPLLAQLVPRGFGRVDCLRILNFALHQAHVKILDKLQKNPALWINNQLGPIPDIEPNLSINKFLAAIEKNKQRDSSYQLTMKRVMGSCVRQFQVNPYRFIQIRGLSFQTIDQIALQNGVSVADPNRIHAYVYDLLEKVPLEGSSYITADNLFQRGLMDLNWNSAARSLSPDEFINLIKQDDAIVVYDVHGETRMTTKHNFLLEARIANKLTKLLKAPRRGAMIKNVNAIIDEQEAEQGWQYDPTQRAGIKTIVNQNVVLLRGSAGVGKTSCLAAVIRILRQNGYSIAACAPSGKAANNLKDVTGTPGRTIHSLINLGINDKRLRPQVNELNTIDVVIVDEFSMVGGQVFNALLTAMHAGTKLILVGDSAQLDAVRDISIMRDVVKSNVVPVVTLTTIHRQAKASAIITHSIDYRHGKTPQDLFLNVNGVNLGEKQDLTYFLPAVSTNLDPDHQQNAIERQNHKQIVELFQQALATGHDLADIEIISSLNHDCDVLNDMVQAKINPPDKFGRAPFIQYANGHGLGDDKVQEFRIGDKILNTKNQKGLPDHDRNPEHDEFGMNYTLAKASGFWEQMVVFILRDNSQNHSIYHG